MSSAVPPTSSTSRKTAFRGDVVEDLDLPPALCVSADTPLSRALELGAMREYDMLPVLDSKKRPIGYLDCKLASQDPTAVQGPTDLPVPQRMVSFRINKRYQVITPETPLEELEAFFQKNSFCVVTDRDRRFVLGIATPEDLAKYVSRRYGSAGVA